MIGKTLQGILESKNINVNELSRRTGISNQTLYSIIKRDNMKVDFEVLLKICSALDVNVECFYSDYLSSAKSTPTYSGYTVFAMDGTAGQHTVTVSEEKSEKLAELLKVARDLPDDKIDMLLKMADSIK